MRVAQHIIRNWLQKLHQLQTDNTELKLRLAKSLERAFSTEALEDAEYFQTQLLNRDAAILLLRRELTSYQHDPISESREYFQYTDADAESSRWEKGILKMELSGLALQQEFDKRMPN